MVAFFSRLIKLLSVTSDIFGKCKDFGTLFGINCPTVTVYNSGVIMVEGIKGS